MKILASFKKYNINSQDKRTGDCVPRALSLAYGMEYSEVRKELQYIAKRNGASYNNMSTVHEFCKKRGDAWKGMNTRRQITVEDYIQDHTSGVHVIMCQSPRETRGGHLTCIIDGDIYDTWDCSDRLVKEVCEVSKGSAVKGSGDMSQFAQDVHDSVEPYLDKLSKFEFIDSVMLTDNISLPDKDTAYLHYYILTSGKVSRGKKYSGDYDYRYRIAVKWNVTQDYDTNLKSNITRIKQKMYDLAYNINDDLKTAYRANSIETHPNFKGDRSLLAKLPDAIVPYVVSAGEYDYGYKYEVYAEPKPGDPREGQVTFSADTLRELKSQIKRYLNDYSRFEYDY